MRIHQSAEDYLEMILRLIETKGYARAIDISYGLSVTKPSVSVAMRNLRENGYITVDESRNIHLTDAGMAIAELEPRMKLLSEHSYNEEMRKYTIRGKLFAIIGKDY